MATESQNDWLATLGSQLADSLESSVALRAVTDLLEEVASAGAAEAPSRATALRTLVGGWLANITAVARAVHAAQLTVIAPRAAAAMNWASSLVRAVARVQVAAERAADADGAPAEAVSDATRSSVSAGVGAAMAAQNEPAPRQQLDRARPDS